MPVGNTDRCFFFCLIGFVRFLEGYYVIFIVRRLKCAMIGFHSIYKIEETKSVYIPNSDSRQSHQDEARSVESDFKGSYTNMNNMFISF